MLNHTRKTHVLNAVYNSMTGPGTDYSSLDDVLTTMDILEEAMTSGVSPARVVRLVRCCAWEHSTNKDRRQTAAAWTMQAILDLENS